MKNGYFSVAIALAVLSVSAAPSEANRGLTKEEIIGATAGGVTGSILGHQSGRTAEGAILGAVTGFAFGNAIGGQTHRQSESRRHPELPREGLREEPQEIPGNHAPNRSAPLEWRASERQQDLLQASPLFTVRRAESSRQAD